MIDRRAAPSAPLLRSPPFPQAPHAIAAVSLPQAWTETAGQPLPPLVEAIRAARVGGAFWAPAIPAALHRHIVLRPRSAEELREMIAAATATGAARGDMLVVPARRPRFLAARAAAAGLAAIAGPVDPWSLLGPAVTLLATDEDEWRLLALLAGDAPAEDVARDPGLRRALVETVAYRDCFGGGPIDAAAAIAILADWRRLIDANRPIVAALGMAWWKRAAIRDFLWADRPAPLRFARDAAAALATAAPAHGSVAVWPSRVPAGFGGEAAAARVPLVTIEDGFIRSIGLGSNLHPPQSIAVDARGIHYDPGRPSDLEHLLETTAFAPALLDRARRLRHDIVARRISKYARGDTPPPPPMRGTRRRVLVTGQVEDDLSVRLGGSGVAGNLDLLVRARRAEPDAEILFKPHPDVDAGHRIGGIDDARALDHADAVVRTPILGLIDTVDAVHVLTSLTGFEALLRGREVVTHGLPFYAGWGLTRDLAGPIARRTRRLTLDELVAGVLILYPRYLDPRTGLPCPPEILLDRFTGPQPRPGPIVRVRTIQGRIAAWLSRTGSPTR